MGGLGAGGLGAGCASMFGMIGTLGKVRLI